MKLKYFAATYQFYHNCQLDIIKISFQLYCFYMYEIYYNSAMKTKQKFKT